MTVISKGEKVVVITRRFFETDLRRHFVGQIEEVTETVMRVFGYAFIFDEITHEFIRRNDQRVRIVSIVDADNIIIVIPSDVAIDSVHYETDDRGRRYITDGNTFRMNVSEFTMTR